MKGCGAAVGIFPPTCGELGTPEFFGRRLQTRATVEDSTADLVLTGRPLDGGLSFHGVSGLCTSFTGT